MAGRSAGVRGRLVTVGGMRIRGILKWVAKLGRQSAEICEGAERRASRCRGKAMRVILMAHERADWCLARSPRSRAGPQTPRGCAARSAG